MTPIATAVEPLRAEAVRFAREHMQKRIERMIAVLKSNDMDVEKVAPYPHGTDADYHEKKRRYDAYRSFTRSIASSRRHRDPCFVTIEQDRIDHHVNLAGEIASEEYTAFIGKLEHKIGAHTVATLDGNHVWGHSILTVTTPSGVQRWKTQQIINVSKLGKVFPQWPSRKIK